MGEGKGTPSVYHLQRGLVEAGHQVHFMIPVREKDKIRTLKNVNFHFFSVPFASLRPRNVQLSRLLTKVNWLFFIFFGWLKASAVAKQTRPDLVYGHTSYGAPIAYLIARKLKVPSVTRLYGTFLYPGLSSFWQRLKKIEEVIAFKIPSGLLIITDDGTRGDEVAKYFKLPENRVRFWMNGVDKGKCDSDFDVVEFKRRLGIAPDVRVVLSVSRLAHWKRVDRLIKAAPEVLSNRDDVLFAVVGDGPESASLHGLARTLGVDNFVKFTGAIPSPEVSEYMNAADIFVSLQNYSNVGNPLLEAMICGKCIVALDTGNTGKIVSSGKTGILLSPDDLESLPKQILRLLDDDALREELGKSARQFALTNFRSWEERIAVEVAEIENLAASSRGRALKSDH
jgi:glycosyltransferase involved in cell wall biosynthesis